MNSVILVTGAGKGLGRAIAELFHERGYTVVATDYDGSLLQDLENRDRYFTTVLDVSDSESTSTIGSVIEARYGRLDAVVNNAGIIGYFPVSEMDPEKIIEHYQVNVFGALRVSHACLGLLEKSAGRILNITSESYRLRTPFQIYQATKLALEGLSDVQRRELSHLGIHVASIRPGAINTALFNAMDDVKNPVPQGRLGKVFNKFVSNLASQKPKSVATAEEMAELVYRAATEPNKKPHYEKNNMLSLKLAALLPSSLVDKQVQKMLS